MGGMITFQVWGVRDELEHLVEVVQWDGQVIQIQALRKMSTAV